MLNGKLPVKAVMIDLDGTLLDTIPDLAAASNMMLEELGRAPLPLETIKTFVGKGIANLVARVLTGHMDGEVEVDRDSLAHAMPIYERHYTAINGRHTTIYPGVKEGLDRLRGMGLPLGVVTNKSGRFTLPLLDYVQLTPYFSTVVSGDTLERKKPHPDPLLHACKALNVQPRDMLMIGDSLNDTQAARSAGCPVFCVTYGYNEGHDVRDLDTDAIVDSLVEAAARVTKA